MFLYRKYRGDAISLCRSQTTKRIWIWDEIEKKINQNNILFFIKSMSHDEGVSIIC